MTSSDALRVHHTYTHTHTYTIHTPRIHATQVNSKLVCITNTERLIIKKRTKFLNEIHMGMCVCVQIRTTTKNANANKFTPHTKN